MKTETLSRRNALRGALAVGCGLCLPALFGCDSKKAPEPSGTAPTMPPEKPSATGTVTPAPSPTPAPTAAPNAAPAAVVKMTKANAQYQTQPKGDQKCSGCLHFVAESNTCKLVEGEISPEGWCILYAKKA